MTREAMALGFLVGLVALFAFGCGGDDAAVAQYHASLEGDIVDRFGRPITAATVVLHSAVDAEDGEGQMVTTAEDGAYRFDVAGFGVVRLVVTAEGFARSVMTVGLQDVPDTVGSFRASNIRDIILYRTDAALEGRITRQQGVTHPLAGVPLKLTLNEGSIRDPSIGVDAMTDEDGGFRFDGLPSGTSVTVLVPAHDVDGDGEPDTAGTSARVDLAHSATTFWPITVGQFDRADAIWSNAQALIVNPDTVLEVYYNVPMDPRPSRTMVRLRQNQPHSFEVFETHAFSEDGRTLLVHPGEPMKPGAQYNLTVNAHSADGQAVNSHYEFAIKADSDTAETPTGLTLETPESDEIDASTSFITIAFDPVANADRYHIYAREREAGIGDWVRVQSFVDSSPTRVVSSFGLASSFANGSGVYFAGGQVIEVAVTAMVGGVESGLSEPLALSDEKCPTFSAPGILSGFNNAGSEVVEIDFDLTFSEPIDRTNLPSISFSGVLDAADVSLSHGRANVVEAIVSIGPGVDATGETMTIDASTVQDLNMNAVCGDASSEISLF